MNNQANKKKWLKRIGLGLIVFLVLAQFVRIDKTNPPVQAENDFINMMNASPNITAMLKTSCYDCHSYETKYPWYTNVAPVSWWIRAHINGAREELNFSEWGTYSDKRKKHKLEECAELIGEDEMPLKSYLLQHAEARLSAAQKTELVNWFKSLQ
ncbi:MAG TPA: cytochrome C [Saprospiraceae bacterium]|nr:cytochrome C [Saprospiraceae bacterium]